MITAAGYTVTTVIARRHIFVVFRTALALFGLFIFSEISFRFEGDGLSASARLWTPGVLPGSPS
jgi:hypothetical protein